nr:MAG TPA: hypothetical protein [Caudoviricetes sp.]
MPREHQRALAAARSGYPGRVFSREKVLLRRPWYPEQHDGPNGADLGSRI